MERLNGTSDFFEFLETFGINLVLILAGFLGALVSVGAKKELSFFGKVLAIFSGGAIANYVTPIISDLLSMKPNLQNGFAFLLGFAGLKGVEWLILTLQKKWGVKKTQDN